MIPNLRRDDRWMGWVPRNGQSTSRGGRRARGKSCRRVVHLVSIAHGRCGIFEPRADDDDGAVASDTKHAWRAVRMPGACRHTKAVVRSSPDATDARRIDASAPSYTRGKLRPALGAGLNSFTSYASGSRSVSVPAGTSRHARFTRQVGTAGACMVARHA